MIIDTHAHLTDPSIYESLDDFLGRAKSAGLKGILSVGTTRETSTSCVEIAKRTTIVRAAVGVHPNYCCQATDDDWRAITEMADLPEVAAIGETGLDRYWDDCPWEIQCAWFRRHIQLSREVKRPVVIHTRDCALEMAEILTEEMTQGKFQAVMHSFTGPQSVADQCVAMGLYISFAGMLTFKNGEEIRSIAATIPADRLLVETDCPYLTPHPHRGKRPNHPALVAHTLDVLAQVRNVSVAEMARQTTENAERLFGAWPQPMQHP